MIRIRDVWLLGVLGAIVWLLAPAWVPLVSETEITGMRAVSGALDQLGSTLILTILWLVKK